MTLPETFEQQLEHQLRQVLSHLYDPSYRVPAGVAKMLAVSPREPIKAIRPIVVAALQDLRPSADVPVHARAWRLYRVLSLRYLDQLTQEQVAQRLSITVRHLAREQALGIALLARYLWENRRTASESPGPAEIVRAETSTGRPSPSRQMEQELASLKRHAPGAVADVGKALQDVVRLTQVLAKQHNVAISLVDIERGALADMHPSVLHQILVATISYAIRYRPDKGSSREIVLSSRVADDAVEINLSSPGLDRTRPPEDWVVYRLLASHGARITFQYEAGCPSTMAITLPLSRSIIVLVVDDNRDLVHFYQLCTVNTIYRIVSVSEGQRAFETIETAKPNIIVLDLMLPDMDGWELLAQLHEHPLSRSLPIIVCSVVREEELALALGAALCISKPVRRQRFRAALDQALDLASKGALTTPASNQASR